MLGIARRILNRNDVCFNLYPPRSSPFIPRLPPAPFRAPPSEQLDIELAASEQALSSSASARSADVIGRPAIPADTGLARVRRINSLMKAALTPLVRRYGPR